jgi:hypothetical protein
MLLPSKPDQNMTVTAPGLMPAQAICASGLPVDVVICTSDLIAFGACRYFLETLGRALPGIIGFDDSPLNDWIAPWPTSIRIPYDAYGAAIVELILADDAGASQTHAFCPTHSLTDFSYGPMKRDLTPDGHFPETDPPPRIKKHRLGKPALQIGRRRTVADSDFGAGRSRPRNASRFFSGATRPRDADLRLDRTRGAPEQGRLDKIDDDTSLLEIAGGRMQRADHAVDLRLPCVGRDGEPHGGQAASGT